MTITLMTAIKIENLATTVKMETIGIAKLKSVWNVQIPISRKFEKCLTIQNYLKVIKTVKICSKTFKCLKPFKIAKEY